MFDQALLREHVEWAEGYRKFPYRDTVGKLSVAIGRNLDDVGISREEATFMLKNDLSNAAADASSFPYWEQLDPVRQIIITDMVFNLGLRKLRGFKRLHKALASRDYSLAAHEMEDSRWARQVGRRARKLIKAMQTGLWK